MRIRTMMRAMALSAAVTTVGALWQPAGAQETAKKEFALPHVLEAIGKAIDQPAPEGLTPAEGKSYAAETAWLETVRSRLATLGTEAGLIPAREAQSGQASGKRTAQPVAGKPDFEAFKRTIATEGRKFNTLSNASKARHDMMMSLIQNMRA